MIKDKKYDFVLTLKKPNQNSANLFSAFLCLLPFLFFVRVFLETGTLQHVLPPVAMLLVGCWNIIKHRNRETIYFKWLFFTIAFGFLLTMQLFGTIWFAILYIIMVVAEVQLKMPLELGFDEFGITRNSFPKKFTPWADLKNIVVRDNMLTLDYKNNNIFQREIAGDYTDEILTEFNEFCIKYLKQV
jgi:hypothetical protein